MQNPDVEPQYHLIVFEASSECGLSEPLSPTAVTVKYHVPGERPLTVAVVAARSGTSIRWSRTNTAEGFDMQADTTWLPPNWLRDHSV
jgi:hypothetical protein